MEGNKPCATEVVRSICNLKSNIQNKYENDFIPEETKKLLLKLENDGIDCKKNQLGVQKFSQTFN